MRKSATKIDHTESNGWSKRKYFYRTKNQNNKQESGENICATEVKINDTSKSYEKNRKLFDNLSSTDYTWQVGDQPQS